MEDKSKGKVLVVRTCNADMTSYNGFVWPKSGVVEAKDFKDNKECGNGLHGWLWSVGDYSNRIGDHDRTWLVVEVEASQIIQLKNKVKFRSGEVIYCGSWWQAFEIVRSRRPSQKLESSATGRLGHASATGDYGHASATGDYGHASATGDYGHASATGYSGHASATGYSGHASATGDSGHASATGRLGHASATGYSGHASATGDSGHASATGYYGHASATGYSGHASATGYSGHASATGDYGHASATGYSGHASATGYYGHASATGDYGIAAALGYCSKVKSGSKGAIVASYYDSKAERPRVLVGYVGEDGIKSDTWYSCESGKWKEVK